MPTMITNEIIFNNNYTKLHGQKHARLLAVITGFSGELLQSRFPDLMLYDTQRDDGRFYKLEPNESYILLLFCGEKGILFTTFRKDNEENFTKYNPSIGQIFKIKIEK